MDEKTKKMIDPDEIDEMEEEQVPEDIPADITPLPRIGSRRA